MLVIISVISTGWSEIDLQALYNTNTITRSLEFTHSKATANALNTHAEWKPHHLSLKLLFLAKESNVFEGSHVTHNPFTITSACTVLFKQPKYQCNKPFERKKEGKKDQRL